MNLHTYVLDSAGGTLCHSKRVLPLETSSNVRQDSSVCLKIRRFFNCGDPLQHYFVDSCNRLCNDCIWTRHEDNSVKQTMIKSDKTVILTFDNHSLHSINWKKDIYDVLLFPRFWWVLSPDGDHGLGSTPLGGRCSVWRCCWTRRFSQNPKGLTIVSSGYYWKLMNILIIWD